MLVEQRGTLIQRAALVYTMPTHNICDIEGHFRIDRNLPSPSAHKSDAWGVEVNLTCVSSNCRCTETGGRKSRCDLASGWVKHPNPSRCYRTPSD